MKNLNLPTLGWVLAACLLFSALSSCKDQKEAVAPSPTNPSSSGPQVTGVEAFIVQPNSLQEIINATGNLIAYEAVEIRPERSGKLVKLDFTEASFVQKGTLLGQIDTEELQAQQYMLNVELDLANKEVERGKELVAVQGISTEELDRLENRVEAIKAQQKVIDVQLEKSEIRAPFSGVVGLRTMSQGAYITPNSVIVELKQINPIKLEFDVPERYLTKVRPGLELSFTIVGTNEIFSAEVYAIGTEISPETRTFKVRATALNGRNILKPGQFAKVTLITGVNDKAMLIPTDAIIPVLDGKQVYVAHNGRAIATFVQTDERQATEVQVIEGLQIGDTILVTGLMALSDGAPIRITNIIESSKQTRQ
ncbi:MAG: efflux RND transporter periplasmic adaptor subunit [Saprospiraceae bacterium]